MEQFLVQQLTFMVSRCLSGMEAQLKFLLLRSGEIKSLPFAEAEQTSLN